MPSQLFIGGMKSGKSLFAEKIALSYLAPRLYIATSEAIDDEMLKRIEKHKERRKGLFDTMEEPLYLAKAVNSINESYNITLIDCLTFWYNNLFYYFDTQNKRDIALDELIYALSNTQKEILLVTNEVGMAIIPENKLSREFIDFSGKANQKIAAICKAVYLVVAGKTLKLE